MSRSYSKSLGKRLLFLPTLVAVACFTLILLLSIYADKELSYALQEKEARTIANSVAYASETVADIKQLSRFISALGGHQEILSIEIIDDETGTLIASTDYAKVGSQAQDMEMLAPGVELERMLSLAPGSFYRDPAGLFLSYSDSISLSRWMDSGLAKRLGRVVVLLDHSSSHKNQERYAWVGISVGILSISIITLVVYLITRSRVLMPLRRIESALTRHKNGEKFTSPVKTQDQLAKLSDTLESTFAALDEQSEQARNLTRRLEFQRDAVDMHAIVSETDAEGQIIYANERFCTTSGYELEDVIGKKHSILNSRYHSGKFWEYMYEQLDFKGVWNGEIRNQKKDGSHFWVDTTIVAFKGLDGGIERYICIQSETTAMNETKFKLIKAKEEVERSLEEAEQSRKRALETAKAKSNFLATMSHEIRTPMNGMLGVLHLLEDELPPDKLKLLETAKQCADDLLILINDVLDLSKIEAGKMAIEAIDVDILQIAEDVCELHAASAQSKAIEIGVSCNPEFDYAIKADPTRIRQIISNLISNAIKFTDTGSVRVLIEGASKLIRVSIIDTGIGIHKDNISKLFTSFTQESSSTSRQFGGTGLGLSICKRLVKLMGGQIWVESEEGAGSKFIFEIPNSKPQEKRQPDAREWELFDKKALLANIDPVAQEWLNAWLGEWNLNCHTLSDFQEEIPPEFDIAIIAESKEESAQDLWKRLREKAPFNKNCIKILLCGLDAPDSVLAGLEGFIKLTKPIRHQNLLGALTTYETWESEALAELAPEDAATEGSRVLIVDDNRTNRLIASQLIGKIGGVDTETAEGGIDAIEKIKSKHYDLIFMDCMMPEVDGYEATRRIRRGEAGAENESSIIIALTANAMPSDRQRCLEAGMNDYLTKPLNPDDLNKTFETWSKKAGKRQKPQTRPEAAQSPDKITTGTSKEKSILEKSILNLDKLNDLYCGDTATILEMLSIFEDSMIDTIEHLSAAVANRNEPENIRFYAHRIRGSAAEFGAAQLSDLASQIEEHCVKSEVDSAVEKFPRAKLAAVAVIDQITKYRGALEEN